MLYSSGADVPLFYCMNKKYITILIVLLLGLLIGAIFFINSSKEKINEQPWKTISVPDYGISIDYPPNLSASYGWQDGTIYFYEGPQIGKYQKILRSRIMLLTNTKLEHHPDGVKVKGFKTLPDGRPYASAAVYSGDKFVDFELYDFNESTANRIISSLKFL